MTDSEQMIACLDNSFDRFAGIFDRSVRRWERVIYPFLGVVGIAGLVAFYLVWSMNRHVGIMQHNISVITSQIETMTRAVGEINVSIQGMGHHMTRLANDVTAMTAAVEALKTHTREMSAHTLRMADSLPALVRNTERMTGSMYRLGHDIGRMAAPMDNAPMRMFSEMMPGGRW